MRRTPAVTITNLSNIVPIRKDEVLLRFKILNGTLVHFAIAENWGGRSRSEVPSGLQDWLLDDFSLKEVEAARLVAKTRVSPLREFDQISMHEHDLLRQVTMMASYLKDKRVLFVGDNDGASRLLGLLGVLGFVPLPERMVLLDFDQRILDCTRRFADEYGFGDRIETRLYNVFDAPPPDLVGGLDWFYINPPYGKSNGGESVCLFMLRGMEMCVPGAGRGCIIIPDANQALWTETAMAKVQHTLLNASWLVSEKLDRMHRYHLPDAPDLTSCTLIAHSQLGACGPFHEYQGRSVPPDDIPRFYGTRVSLPFPRYIRLDGSKDEDWGV